jgi:RNA polymerase sigma factor (sigma-70 family)
MNERNLTDLSTQWSAILRAGQAEDGAAARNELLVRYHAAVLSYLRGKLPDERVAEEVCSNFVLRVLQGDPFLQRADPGRGRFRDYLKSVLRNMVSDYYRRQQREDRKREPLLTGDGHDADPALTDSAEEEQFLHFWRQELVNQTWNALGQMEKRTGQPYCVLLRLQEEQPGVRSAQLAEQLTARLGRPFTAAGVRQLVHRAREMFGDLLVAEVARSLEANPADPEGADRVEAEMIDLKLLFSYCKAALERRRQSQ